MLSTEKSHSNGQGRARQPAPHCGGPLRAVCRPRRRSGLLTSDVYHFSSYLSYRSYWSHPSHFLPKRHPVEGCGRLRKAKEAFNPHLGVRIQKLQKTRESSRIRTATHQKIYPPRRSIFHPLYSFALPDPLISITDSRLFKPIYTYSSIFGPLPPGSIYLRPLCLRARWFNFPIRVHPWFKIYKNQGLQTDCKPPQTKKLPLARPEIL